MDTHFRSLVHSTLKTKDRKWLRQFLTAAVVGGSLIAVPQLANAAITDQTPNAAETTTQFFTNNPGEEGVSVVPGADFNVATAGGAVGITGTGTITYDAQDAANTLTSTNGLGLDVVNLGDYATPATPGSISITTNADITGATGGIYVSNSGTGGITIDSSSATVTATAFGFYNGINVSNSVNSTEDVEITTGDVSSLYDAIQVSQAGTGNVSIDTTAGTVTGDADSTLGGAGIRATIQNTASEGNLVIETGAVTSPTDYAIFANNTGKGGVDVTSNGAVSGTTGIWAQAGNWGPADGTYNGSVIVTAKGDVTGTAGNGIYIYNEHLGDDADPERSSSTVTTSGNVTGSANGIYVWNAADAGATGTHTDINITATAGTISGGGYGIFAQNDGAYDSNIAINTEGATVTGTGNSGIYALNWNGNGTGDISITTGDVSSDSTAAAIYAQNNGTGGITVDSTAGTLNADSNDGVSGDNFSWNGVYAVTSGTSIGDISINTADVKGLDNAIFAQQNGTGNLIIDTTAGSVEGDTDGGLGNGIDAAITNGLATGNLEITTADVSSRTGIGINAANAGTGHTTVNSTAGTVTGGASNDGINASNTNANSGDIDITTANVIAGNTAILALQSGTGAVNIDSTAGTLWADTDNGGAGLAVNTEINNGASTADITITTADAYAYGGAGAGTTGVNSVIAAANHGTGGINIDTTAGEVKAVHYTDPANGDYTPDATGTASGISALIDNGNATGNLDVTTGDVTGGLWGIHAVNAGTGDVNINTVGTDGEATVMGSLPGPLGDFDGIYAQNNQGNVNVTAHNVYGDDHGIHVVTNSSVDNATRSGNVTVDGTVAGYYAGIYQWGFTSQNTIIEEGGVVKTIDFSDPATPDVPKDFAPEVASTRDAIVIDGWHDDSGVGLANTVTNAGTIIGNIISVDEGTETITNTGIWNNAGGASNLTAGDDTFNNEVGGSYLAANLVGATTTTLYNTETVNDNGGDFVMQNRDERITGDPASNDPMDPAYSTYSAYVGDVISMPQSTFNTGGGNLLVDTDIANGLSDELHVQNITLGQVTNPSDPSGPTVAAPTLVNVNVTDGLGQPTAPYHNGDGILVANVTGTSDADALQLDSELRGGLYTYSLQQGANDIANNGTQSWYLQAGLNAEALAAGSASVMGSRSALASLSNLHDRQRDVETLDDYSESRKGVWGRVFGQGNDFETNVSDGSGTTATSGFESDLWGVQAGLDFLAKGDEAGNRKYAGLYLAYADSSGHFTNDGARIGKMDMNTTSVGLYYTKYTDANWYLDLVGQYSHLGSGKIKSADNDLKTGGNSYALSLEVGKQFNPKGSVVSEVQAQLIDQYTDMDDLTLSDGTQLAVSSTNAVTGRFGVRLYGNPRQEGKSFLPWVRANIWHTFNTTSKVSSLGNTLSTPIGGTSGELELGFSKGHAESGGWGFYGSAGYLFDLGGAEYSGWKGTLGMRKGW